MAYYNIRKGGRVFVYISKNGKQQTLPRDLTKHLDRQPECNIKAWVKHYTQYVEKRLHPVTPPITPRLENLLDQYISYIKSRNKAKATISDHRRSLVNYIFPYFISENVNDLEGWPFRSIKLLEYLQDKKTSIDNILKANTALTAFWEWLEDEQIIRTGLKIKVRRPVIPFKETPLKHTHTPESIIQFIKSCTKPDIRLMCLLGYFFSIRTQEIFGLTKSSFLAGSAALEKECSKVMVQHGMYGKLVVYVKQQKTSDSKLIDPKRGSKGYVACFDQDAAKLIVKYLNGLSKAPDELLFDFVVDTNIGRWGKDGITGVTLKDLRRASLYWLGHYTDLPLIALKNHARHNKASTTERYMRRPEEYVNPLATLDLDA